MADCTIRAWQSTGRTAVYLTDAGIGAAGMLNSTPAFETLPYGIERYHSTTAAAQTNRTIVAHDTIQIMLGIKTGMGK